MKLFTNQELLNCKSRGYLKFRCDMCQKEFTRRKHNYQIYKFRNKNEFDFCCSKCSNEKISNAERIKLNCSLCYKEFYRTIGHIKKSKSGNTFCSQTCSITYNNTHKTTGNRRSKLEIWIESKLTDLYPNIRIDYNKKDTINSELDIYIPSLKLAIELNGIFHYEPIYGEHKLEQIKNNDHRKMIACYEKGIELLLIDTSGMKYFEESNAQKYLDIIINHLVLTSQRHVEAD